MKLLVMILTLTSFSSLASTQTMSFEDNMQVPKVVMNYMLPMNMIELHRDFYFNDRMIAGKKDTQTWSDRLRTRLQSGGLKNLNAFLD
ncbi:hypothetical protein [Peredibacter starrii]|uniref:Uncharacterized protein n=1 Tax=Peredibacter starrii TaxID=28202 RepID=A0AAX4HJR8_9BACT|nr:hypothetical protein [Peredibacter starrii]WPU63485.1 hypothetical protein SOO65_12375 [Peredibacter starrii]